MMRNFKYPSSYQVISTIGGKKMNEQQLLTLDEAIALVKLSTDLNYQSRDVSPSPHYCREGFEGVIVAPSFRDTRYHFQALAHFNPLNNSKLLGTSLEIRVDSSESQPLLTDPNYSVSRATVSLESLGRQHPHVINQQKILELISFLQRKTAINESNVEYQLIKPHIEKLRGLLVEKTQDD